MPILPRRSARIAQKTASVPPAPPLKAAKTKAGISKTKNAPAAPRPSSQSGSSFSASAPPAPVAGVTSPPSPKASRPLPPTTPPPAASLGAPASPAQANAQAAARPLPPTPPRATSIQAPASTQAVAAGTSGRPQRNTRNPAPSYAGNHDGVDSKQADPNFGANKINIDPKTKINTPTKTPLPDGSMEHRYQNQYKDSARVTVSPGGNTRTFDVVSHGRLPSNTRTETGKLNNLVSIHNGAKGSKGGAKYDPNTLVNAHQASSHLMRIPATNASLNGVPQSQGANHKDSRVEHQVDGKVSKNDTVRLQGTVKLETPNNPDRVREVASQPGIQVDEKRIQARNDALVAANPDAKALRSKDLQYSVNGKEVGRNTQGRDLEYGTKKEWFDANYDPSKSPGDKDIRPRKK